MFMYPGVLPRLVATIGWRQKVIRFRSLENLTWTSMFFQ